MDASLVRAVAPVEMSMFARIYPALPALPVSLTPFLGRDTERAEILALLRREDVRLITLTGPGGIGKTRMALNIAREATTDFRNGVAFVGLAPISDPAHVPSAIKAALNSPEQADLPVLASITNGIGDRQLLIVVDNFEQVISAAPVLSALLQASPTIKILVTSRERLELTGEHLYPIAPLPLPEESSALDPGLLESNAAVGLFMHAVKAVRPDFAITNESALPVVRICRQLEGWPLALELAAARTTALSMPALLSRLSNRLSVLTGGPRDGQVRFRSMRDAIAWSYHLLEPGEQTVFARFSVFTGGCSLEAAESVLADPHDPIPVFDRIESLVNKCLLRLDPSTGAESRYVMLETIREFATDELASRGETRHYLDRHADWFVELAKVGGWNLKSNEAPIWIDRLVSNRDNLRAAMNWLDQSGQSERFLNMATYLATFWDYRGELNEGRFWLERAFARIDADAAPTESLARAKSWFGWFQLRQDQLDAAYATLSEALPLWIAAEKQDGEAYAQGLLGTIDQIRGNYAEARRSYELALALFAEVNEIPGGIEALLHLSDLDHQIGNSDSALETALNALERSEREEIRTYIAVSQIAVSQAKTARGDARGALEAARTGLMVARGLGFTACAADGLSCIAATAASLNKLEPASTLLGAAEAWLKSTGGARFFYHHQFQRTMETVRQGLGPTRFQRGWETGQALPDDEILALVASIDSDRSESIRPIQKLTARETEVLGLLAAGKSDKEIAEALFITYRTANAYVAKLLDKLDVPSRTAAAALAIREGLVS